LGAEQGVGNFRFAGNDRLDSLWLLAFPTRTGDEEITAVVSERPGAEVGEIEGLQINQLGRVRSGSGLVLGTRIDAEFLSDMGELFRVHETAVCHHRAQGR
jgi:hypothetical protein